MFTIAKTKNPDWEAIRAEYIGGSVSQTTLAKKYKVSYPTLRDRAQREKWTKARAKARQKGVEKAADKSAKAIANEAAKNAIKLEKIRSLAIDHLLRQIEGMPKNGGTHTRQSQTDRQTGRQMTIDYDLQTIINALEKLSNGTAADSDRQKRFMEENNETMMTYADLFSRPARSRTIEELETGGRDV